MPNILEILARAQSLKQETALNSITPNRAGGIMYDTLIVLNQMQLEGGSLLISKVYASVSAMEADTTPTSDLTGRALRSGQLVVIVPTNTSSDDLGSVYRYNGPGSWSFTGKIGGLPLDTVPTQNSTNGITSGAVYNALTALKNEGYKYMGIATPGDSGTSPGTPHQPVFYVAGPGTYPNFGGLTVAAGYLGFLSYSGGTWSVQSVAVGKDYDAQLATVDGQISQLNLKESVLYSYNIKTGYGIRVSDGTEYAIASRSCTDYIDISLFNKITYAKIVSTSTNNNFGLAFYDSEKDLISPVIPGVAKASDNGYITETVDKPEGAVYARFTLYTNPSYGRFYFCDPTRDSLEKRMLSHEAEIDTLDNLVGLEGERYDLTEASDFTGDSNTGWYVMHGAVASFVTDHFLVDCSASTQSYPGIRNNPLALQVKAFGKAVTIRFWAKLAQGSPDSREFRLYLSSGTYYGWYLTADWAQYKVVLTAADVSALERLQFCMEKVNLSAITGLGFDIKMLSFEIDGSLIDRVSVLEDKVKKDESDAAELENRVATLEDDASPILRGKKIAVIGDSISTINGGNTPYIKVLSGDVGNEIQSYVTWWDVWTDDDGETPTNKTIGGVALTSAMIGTLQTFTPVADDIGKEIGVSKNYNNVSTKVWSQRLCEKTGAVLLANASWSGARICSGQGGQYVLSEAWSDYTIGCCKVRDEEGNVVTPDVVIIYRGTNDFSHSPVSRIDDVSLADGIPASDYIDSVYQYRVGYYKTVQKLRTAYPNATIVCCTLNVFKRQTYDVFPTRNSRYTLPQMSDAIREIANMMGCGLIELDKDGITFENCYPTYISDNSDHPTHPNNNGHEVMARKALADLKYILIPPEE